MRTLIKDKFSEKLGNLLKLKFDTNAKWASALNVTRPTLTHWLKGTNVPSPQNMLSIKEVILNSELDSDKAEKIKADLDNFYNTDLIKLTVNYTKFKAKNLYDYVAKFELERISNIIKLIVIPSRDKELFYKQIGDLIIKFSRINKEERISAIENLGQPKRFSVSIFVVVSGVLRERKCIVEGKNLCLPSNISLKEKPKDKAQSYSLLAPMAASDS